MSVKMRLARHGRKRYAFYHIVVANSRAPRDGRYIERIGSYNPNTNPATIDLDFDKAFDWLEKGAQPTDTVRAILSYKGVLYKKHLAGGVKKGAFSQEEAERKLDLWLNEKETKIQAKKNMLSTISDKLRSEQLEAEAKVNDDRTKSLVAKASAIAAEAKAAQEAATAETAKVVAEEVAPVEEEAAVEVPEVETPVEEEAVVEVPEVETPVEEEAVVEVPEVEAPVEEAAVVEIPEVKAPEVETPVDEAPAEGEEKQ